MQSPLQASEQCQKIDLIGNIFSLLESFLPIAETCCKLDFSCYKWKMKLGPSASKRQQFKNGTNNILKKLGLNLGDQKANNNRLFLNLKRIPLARVQNDLLRLLFSRVISAALHRKRQKHHSIRVFCAPDCDFEKVFSHFCMKELQVGLHNIRGYQHQLKEVFRPKKALKGLRSSQCEEASTSETHQK